MKIVFEVINKFLTQEELNEELLKTEVKMNDGSKLRFHLVEVNEEK